MTSYPTLYKEGRNGLVEWHVRTDESKIIVEEGLVTGKKRIHQRIATGKNKGKKNETSDAQQAIVEAKSKWKNKFNLGYRQEGETSNSNTRKDESLCPVSPVLAYTYNKGKPIYPGYSQPKLDGVRCVAERKENKINLYSRGMVQYYFLNHIREELQELFKYIDPYDYFDGELFNTKLGFQEIQSITRQEKEPHPDEYMLQYHIFDLIDIHTASDNFEGRYNELKNLFESNNKLRYVKLVQTHLVNTEDEMKKKHEEFEKDGYEGLIFRNIKGVYPKTSRYRSKDLLKVKSWKDDEAIIIGYTVSKGNHAGAVIWKVRNEDLEFSVTPEATMEERINMANNANDYIGSILTYKYQDVYESGKPKFAVGKGYRNEKDMPK